MKRVVFLTLLLECTFAFTGTQVYMAQTESEMSEGGLTCHSVIFLLFDEYKDLPASFQMVITGANFDSRKKFCGFDSFPIVFTGDYIKKEDGSLDVWYKLTYPGNMLMTINCSFEQWTPRKVIVQDGFKDQMIFDVWDGCRSHQRIFHKLKKWKGITMQFVAEKYEFGFIQQQNVKNGGIFLDYQHYYLHPRHYKNRNRGQ